MLMNWPIHISMPRRFGRNQRANQDKKTGAIVVDSDALDRCGERRSILSWIGGNYSPIATRNQ